MDFVHDDREGGMGMGMIFSTHILNNQPPQTMREKDDRSDSLILLTPFVDEVLIERFGMILYIAFADWTEEFHDV